MNLILWRHAEAFDLGELVAPGCKRDLARVLTPRGHKQAASTAEWLRQHLKQRFRVVSSPALRAQQTAKAFTDQVEILHELGPLADVTHVLGAIHWPEGDDVIIVGHQPWLGQLASLLLSGSEQNWSVKKSGLWWLTHRDRKPEQEDRAQTVLRLVLPPDLID